MAENVLFLLDSLAYMVGHLVYMWDLRAAMVRNIAPPVVPRSSRQGEEEEGNAML